METAEFCQLFSREQDKPHVELADGEKIVLGRSPLTCITDKKCSRDQVEVTANFNKKELIVRHIGVSCSVAGGSELKKGQTTTIGAGAELELLKGHHRYSVFFGQRLKTVNTNEGSELSAESKTKKFKQDESPVSNECQEAVSLNTPQSSSAAKEVLATSEDSSASNSMLASSMSGLMNKIPSPLSKVPSQSSLLKFFSKPQASGSGAGKEKYRFNWKKSESLLVFTYDIVDKPASSSTRIASFDMDGTIITTKSGKLPFRTPPDDWKFLFKCVPEKLKSLYHEGYQIVLFTNQAGMMRGNPPLESFQLKIQAVAEALHCVPFTLIATLRDDLYRKPCTGMWQYFMQHECVCRAGVELDQSFYVGDAAGRFENWKIGAKKDFACSDRQFAANVNIPFHTPEEFFLGYPKCRQFSWGEFDPRSLDYDQVMPLCHPPSASITSPTQELVVFVGSPASGKTSFYHNYMKPAGYAHVNRDQLGSWQKCAAECVTLLLTGCSVVIDNTNPDPESRKRYVPFAKAQDLPARCFLFTTSLSQALHNNKFRELTNKSPDYKKVSPFVFSSYKSKFVPPRLEEGFTEILNIPFSPKFSDVEMKNLYRQFIL